MRGRPLVEAVRLLVTLPPATRSSMPAPAPMSAAQVHDVGRSPGARRAMETDLAVSAMYRVMGMYPEAAIYSGELVALAHVAEEAGAPKTAGNHVARLYPSSDP